MDLKTTSSVPKPRLTEHALRRHAKASAHRPKLRTASQHTSPVTADTLPSTEILDAESVARMEDAADQILTDPKQRQDLLAAFGKDPEVFGMAYPVATLARETIHLVDTRPSHARPCFIPPSAPQVNGTRSLLLTPGSRIAPPTIEAGAAEPPQQSINSGHDSARLIKTTSAQEGQLENAFPSHFPPFQHVQSHGELGFYVDRSRYAINVGSGPVDDLRYGIIIVPLGEEHILFGSGHVVSREAPRGTQQEPSLRAAAADEAQLRVNDSASPPAARHSLADLAAVSEIRGPPKRKRDGREKSSRVAKAARTPHPQPLAPTRRNQRLNANRHTT